MEKNFNSDDLGSNLEETLLLNEQHNKFARVVALQEEKFNHLAQFQIVGFVLMIRINVDADMCR